MSRKPVLTKDEIDEARRMKEDQGKSNREIARHFHVGKTTIWDNIFATERRIRVYEKKVIDNRTPCPRCGIKLTRDVKIFHPRPMYIYQIPMGFRIGDICLGCFLASKGLTVVDLSN